MQTMQNRRRRQYPLDYMSTKHNSTKGTYTESTSESLKKNQDKRTGLTTTNRKFRYQVLQHRRGSNKNIDTQYAGPNEYGST